MFKYALVLKDKGDLALSARVLEKALKTIQDLDAVPCIALSRMSLGTVMGLCGKKKKPTLIERGPKATGESRSHAGPVRGLSCSGNLQAGRESTLEANSICPQAETLIFRTDYQPLKIQLYSAQADLHLAEKRLS